VWRGHSCPRYAVWRPRPCLVRQSISNVLASHSRDTNDFIPAALAGRNGNGTSRHLQKFRKEFDASFVGPPLNRRSGQRNFQRIPHLASDPILLRPRMHLDRKRRPVAGLTNRNHRSMLQCRESDSSMNNCNTNTYIEQVIAHTMGWYEYLAKLGERAINHN